MKMRKSIFVMAAVVGTVSASAAPASLNSAVVARSAGELEIDPHRPALPAAKPADEPSVHRRWARAQMPMPAGEAAREAYLRGLDLAESGDHDDAVNAFSEAASMERSFRPAVEARASSLLALQRWNSAIADLTTLLRSDPSNADLLARRGAALLREGDAERAWRDLSTSLSLAGGDAALHSDLAAACLARGDAYGAVEAANKAIAMDPESGPAHLTRGLAKLTLQKHHDALRDLSLALEYSPGDARAYAARAEARENLGEIRGAIDDATAALEIDPGLTTLRLARALNHIRLGEHDSARADCEAVASSSASSEQSRASARRILDRLTRTVASVNEISAR